MYSYSLDLRLASAARTPESSAGADRDQLRQTKQFHRLRRSEKESVNMATRGSRRTA